jgi:hypothetical protein
LDGVDLAVVLDFDNDREPGRFDRDAEIAPDPSCCRTYSIGPAESFETILIFP